MLSEEELIRRLNELRASDDFHERDADAIYLIIDFLEQLGKHKVADALRDVNLPPERQRPALRLVK
ncbi:hypothetical protein SAMN02982989_3432 [Xaviernesmea oryzae]|uniref:Uncharacterized protein n=1 Tax=Xaviernesmea oryzae TaxID=464029 RepID=A0A1X7G8S8_9HYPH|nr:hypothetical protein [Xaviernesmea oryzae]SMF66015.1 hypothetical protein SAMN02982989_3432 [Xaviernesmea oryzae]